jgi:hypothetical protein
MSAGDIVTIDLAAWAEWALDWWGEFNANGLYTVLIGCAVALFILGAIFQASGSQGDNT